MMSTSNLTAKIGPSILNADLASLSLECEQLISNGADYLHLDVMDGNFVPNLTFGHPVVACLRRQVTQAFFDMHMMVGQPKRWINPMADAGANQYTFHQEATLDHEDTVECIRLVKEAGMKVGIAIKPKTPVDVLFPYIESVDMVLVMTVEPGFGGQQFMVDQMDKVQLLRSKYHELDIEVDGGVGPNTINHCANAGANMIVSGTAVINAPDQRQVISMMRDTVKDAIQRSQLER